MPILGANHGAISYGHIGADYRACATYGPLYGAY